MEEPYLLVWGLVFGAVGLGFHIYGKKQKAMVPIFTGIALFIVPCFVSNVHGYPGEACI